MADGVRTRVIRSGVAMVSLALAVTLLPGTTAQAKTRPVVPMELFGMHYQAISTTTPAFRVGAVRLWDSGLSWAMLQPTPEAIAWGPLDAAVANALAGGAREIQYVFGHTPAWAAADPGAPGPAGNGTASAPAQLQHYLDFVRAVAERYRGRITSYDPWNEGSLKRSFTGTAKELAAMTIEASRTITSLDPAATVLAPSITASVLDRRAGFWRDFAKRLKKAGWPVDAVNVHAATTKPDHLARRLAAIARVRKAYRAYGFTGPIWDTQVNHGAPGGLETGWKPVEHAGEPSAGVLARTYIDSMRTGVRRVFWHGWDMHAAGLDTLDPATGAVTSAGIAFRTVQEWMATKHWWGCSVSRSIRLCRLRGQDGSRSTIAYATGGTRTLRIPAGVSVFENLAGASVPVVAGQRIALTGVPILLRGV